MLIHPRDHHGLTGQIEVSVTLLGTAPSALPSSKKRRDNSSGSLPSMRASGDNHSAGDSSDEHSSSSKSSKKKKRFSVAKLTGDFADSWNKAFDNAKKVVDPVLGTGASGGGSSSRLHRTSSSKLSTSTSSSQLHRTASHAEMNAEDASDDDSNGHQRERSQSVTHHR